MDNNRTRPGTNEVDVIYSNDDTLTTIDMNKIAGVKLSMDSNLESIKQKTSLHKRKRRATHSSDVIPKLQKRSKNVHNGGSFKVPFTPHITHDESDGDIDEERTFVKDIHLTNATTTMKKSAIGSSSVANKFEPNLSRLQHGSDGGGKSVTVDLEFVRPQNGPCNVTIDEVLSTLATSSKSNVTCKIRTLHLNRMSSVIHAAYDEYASNDDGAMIDVQNLKLTACHFTTSSIRRVQNTMINSLVTLYIYNVR